MFLWALTWPFLAQAAAPPASVRLDIAAGEIERVRLSPSGKRYVVLWTEDAHSEARVFDTDTGAAIARIPVGRITEDSTYDPRGICLDGESLGVVHGLGVDRIDLQTGAVSSTLSWEGGAPWEAVALSRDCGVATWVRSDDHTVHLVDLATGHDQELGRVPAPEDSFYNLRTTDHHVMVSRGDKLWVFGADGERTAGGHADATVGPDGIFLVHTHPPESDHDLPGGPLGAASIERQGGWSHTLQTPSPYRWEHGIPMLAMGPRGPLVVAGGTLTAFGSDGEQLGSVPLRVTSSPFDVRTVFFDAVGARAIAVAEGDRVIVVDLSSETPRRFAGSGDPPVQPRRIEDFRIVDERTVVLSYADRTIGRWHLDTGEHEYVQLPDERPALLADGTVVQNGGMILSPDLHFDPFETPPQADEYADLRTPCLAGGRLVAGDEHVLGEVVDGEIQPFLKGGGMRQTRCSRDAGRVAVQKDFVSDRAVHLFDLDGGRKTLKRKGWSLDLLSGAYSPDGRWFVIGAWRDQHREDRALAFRDGTEVHPSTNRWLEWLYRPAVDDNGRVASADIDGTIRVLELERDAAPVVLRGHRRGVKLLRIDRTGRIWSAGEDGELAVWDVADPEEPIARFYSVAPDLHAILLADGRYLTSPGLLGNLKVGGAGGERPARDLDSALNRPDLVLETLGVSDEAHLEEIRAAVALRRKLDADAHRVEARLTISAVPDLVSADSVAIPIRVEAAARPGVSVRVDGAPVTLPVELVEQSDGWSGVLQVPLSVGVNRVDITAGTASRVLEIERVGEPEGRVVVLAVGVADYADDALDLTYAGTDAEHVVAMFDGPSFDDAQTVLLRDGEAGLAAVKEALAALADTRPGDTVVVFLAGHGLVGPSGEYVFATHDLDLDDPEATGLTDSDLDKAIRAAGAHRRVVLLDTCHAGRSALAGPAGPLPDGVRSIPVLQVQESAESAGAGRIEELFIELGRDSGANIIGAAGGAEVAFESADWSGGVFTRALVDGLEAGLADLDGNGTIAVSELHRYLPDRVSELTGGQQRPVSREMNLLADVALRVPRLPAAVIGHQGLVRGELPAGGLVYGWGGELRWQAADGPRKLAVPEDFARGWVIGEPAGAGVLMRTYDDDTARVHFLDLATGKANLVLTGIKEHTPQILTGDVAWFAMASTENRFDVAELVGVEFASGSVRQRLPNDGRRAFEVDGPVVTEAGVVGMRSQVDVWRPVAWTHDGGVVFGLEGEDDVPVFRRGDTRIPVQVGTRAVHSWGSGARLTLDGRFLAMVDGARFLVRPADGGLRVWSTETGLEIPVTAEHAQKVAPIGGSWIAVMTRRPYSDDPADRQVLVFDLSR